MLVTPRTESSCDRQQRESLHVAVFSYLGSGVLRSGRPFEVCELSQMVSGSTPQQAERVGHPELATWADQPNIKRRQPEC